MYTRMAGNWLVDAWFQNLMILLVLILRIYTPLSVLPHGMKAGNLKSGQFCSIHPQVLGFKALNGNPSKQRLKLWDGRSELTQAVLDLEGRPGLGVPANYSVIRLEGVKLKQAGEKWAIIVAGYCLLKPGGLVGRKIQDTPTSPGQVQ